jgi:DNA repair protein RadD
MLRDYQQAAVDATIAYLCEHKEKHPVVSLPTGAGKSHVIAALVAWAMSHADTAVLIVTHTKELVEQDAVKIREALPAIPVGIYCAGLRQKKVAPVTVASIQSIFRKVGQMLPFDLIIVDEAHRIPHGDDGMYRAMFAAQPQARIIGLTATPYRLNGGMLHEGDDALFDDLIFEGSTAELIDRGYLCRVRARATPAHADLRNVHMRGGEFIQHEMTKAFDQEQLTKKAVEDVLTNAKGRHSIMVFGCSIEHCRHIESAFKSHGEPSVATITNETFPGDRARIINQFKAGIIRVLVNCNVLTTGFDSPNVDCIVLLRATQSPGLYVQIVGRGLRTHDSKDDCILLDYGMNVERHGPLDTITAERATSGEGPAPTKTCPQCAHIILAGFRTCPECGYVFPPNNEDNPPHDTKAGTVDPISAAVIEEFPVSDVTYDRWNGKNGKLSLRVGYRVGLFRWVYEWVCPEHTGFAQEKAARWFARRGMVPMPRTVESALEHKDTLLKPVAIAVKRAGKYPEVISYTFGGLS